MITEELLNFIKKEKSLGQTDDQVKAKLLLGGWNSLDVEEGFKQINSNSQIPPSISTGPEISASSSIQLSKSKKIIPIILVVILVFVIGSLGYFYRNQLSNLPVLKNIFQNTEVIEIDQLGNETENPSMAIAPAGEVKDCGTDIDCLILASKNCELAKANLTSTLNIFEMLVTTTTFYEIKGMQVDKCVTYHRTENQTVDLSEELKNQAIKQGVTQEEIEIQKQKSNEMAKLAKGLDGVCKYYVADLTQLLNEMKIGNYDNEYYDKGNCEENTSPAAQKALKDMSINLGFEVPSDPNGFVDLVITGVNVYPDRPIVNSNDFRISFTVKNIGTKSSDFNTHGVAKLLGFEKKGPQGLTFSSIAPQESYTYRFIEPYENNEMFKISDVPGEKTIQIEINNDRKTIESNYDNNIFTKEIEVFSN